MTGIGHNSGETIDDLNARPGDWIALSRKVREHPIVGIGNPVTPADPQRGSCSRFEAWFDLLCLAQWKPSRIDNKGQVMTLDVGQLMGSRAYLADRWNWTEKTVRGFLLRMELDGMIARGNADSAKQGQQNGQQKSNKCNVITICNYARYQLLQDAISSYVEATNRASKGPAKGQQGASEGPQLNTGTPKQDSPPFPPSGGAAPKKARKAGDGKRAFTAAEAKLSDEAFDAYNGAARRLGFYECAVRGEVRRRRLLKRLAEIGGMENFKVALAQIERVPFLMGKTPPRPGEPPFKLDIDRLMQDRGPGLGDVLAKLIEKARSSTDLVSPNGKSWGWWRGKEAEYRAMSLDYWRQLDAECKPNGTWPWWIMGAPPGHEECIMPAELVAERGYVEIYKGKVSHV